MLYCIISYDSRLEALQGHEQEAAEGRRRRDSGGRAPGLCLLGTMIQNIIRHHVRKHLKTLETSQDVGSPSFRQSHDQVGE